MSIPNISNFQFHEACPFTFVYFGIVQDDILNGGTVTINDDDQIVNVQVAYDMTTGFFFYAPAKFAHSPSGLVTATYVAFDGDTCHANDLY